MNHHILFKTKFASLMRYFRDKILIPLSKENTGSPFNSGLIAYTYIAHNEAIYVARCSHETKIGSHPYPISHCKFRDLTENGISQEIKNTQTHTLNKIIYLISFSYCDKPDVYFYSDLYLFHVNISLLLSVIDFTERFIQR